MCRAPDADDAAGVRPGHDAPFCCPLTGDALSGRGKAVLHRPTGLLVSEKGLKTVPELARAALLEAAQAQLADGAPKAARAVLEAVVAAEGRWEAAELLTVNPEGQEAEDARDRVMFIAQKVLFSEFSAPACASCSSPCRICYPPFRVSCKSRGAGAKLAALVSAVAPGL